MVPVGRPFCYCSTTEPLVEVNNSIGAVVSEGEDYIKRGNLTHQTVGISNQHPADVRASWSRHLQAATSSPLSRQAIIHAFSPAPLLDFDAKSGLSFPLICCLLHSQQLRPKRQYGWCYRSRGMQRCLRTGATQSARVCFCRSHGWHRSGYP